MKKIEIIFSVLFAALTLTLTTANIASAKTSHSGSSSGSSDSGGSTSSGTGSSDNSGSSSSSGASDSSGSSTPSGTTPNGPGGPIAPVTPPPVTPPPVTPPPVTPPPVTPPPTIPHNCKYIDNGSKVVCSDKDVKRSSSTTIIKYKGGGYTGGQTSGIVMLPSTAKDFANNEPKTLTLDFVNPTGPDSIGNYWVKGEVVNNGNSTLQNLKITAHWFDAGNKIIGVTYGYTDKLNTNLNSGDRSTFSIMADGHNDLIGTPRFVELSYDWQ